MKDISSAISNVDWLSLETAYGSAKMTPIHLSSLAMANENDQLKACHELWCSLCHQHAYVSSAAEPAFPILLTIFVSVNELVQVEIMDIFMGFAACTSPGHPNSEDSFQKRLRSLLLDEREFFDKLCSHPNKEISSFSEGIVECLEANT